MQLKMKTIILLLGACCALTARAQGVAGDIPTLAQDYVQRAQPLLLAEAESAGTAAATPAAAVSTPQTPYEPPLLTGSNTHLALGLTTIALAAATAATAPGENEGALPANYVRETNGTHAKLAKATVAMAAATITSGLLVHWDDFHLEDGLTDPDNLHVLLGVSGAALMAYAVNKSANSSVPVSHAGMAELGALGMVAAIKLTW